MHTLRSYLFSFSERWADLFFGPDLTTVLGEQELTDYLYRPATRAEQPLARR